MYKQRSALLLIVVLLALLLSWWLLSGGFSVFVSEPRAANRAEAQGQQQTHLAFDETYAPPKSLHLSHVTHKHMDTSSGTLTLPNCDTFSTHMSISSASPAAVSLALVVAKGDPLCTDVGTSTAPFSVSYGADAHGAVLKNILVNERSVPFSVIETKK